MRTLLVELVREMKAQRAKVGESVEAQTRFVTSRLELIR